jgi:tetratricopeptide (TPR) repeat protein/predicted Ser/Thr protein kinase
MTPERYQRVREVYRLAEALPPAERLGFLEDTCGHDQELRSAVEDLLLAAAGPTGPEPVGKPQERIAEAPPSIGRYEIIRELGAGGMGAVFLAQRTGDFRHRVAIKVLQHGANLRSIAARFQNERQILAGLQHSNIARILDGGATEDGRPYYVMEYVDGLPLDRYCAEHKLSTKDRIRLFLPICDAVQYAHRNLVIHRDLKPANILVSRAGVPILLDFGIAKVLNPDLIADGEVTMTGMRIMTPRYASPEQVRGERASTASDVYSLGVILYELLSGNRPYRLEHGTTMELEKAIAEQEPAPPAGLDSELANILAKSLRKETDRRYQSASELADDLRRYLDGRPVSAQPDSFAYRAGKFVRRNRLAAGAAALLFLSLAGGIVATTRQARIAERRFQEVRTLANSFLFEFHDAIANLSGSTPARKLVVSKAQEYLARLAAESSGDPQLLREVAEAYMRVGDIQGNPTGANLGDTKAAMASYRKALAIREKLAAAAPGDAKLKSELGDTVTTIGQMHITMGETDAGVKHTRRGLDLAAEALAADPANFKRYIMLAGQYRGLGDSLLQTNQTNEAREAFAKSLSLSEQAVKLKPDNTDARSDLALALQWTGKGHEAAGAQPQAAESYAKALEIRKGLAARDPANARFQMSLALTHIAIGDMLWDGGSAGQALTSYDAALPVVESLVRRDPKDERGNSVLAALQARRGDAQASAGQWAAALKTQQDALAGAEELVRKDPANATSRYNLAISLGKVAQALVELGRADEALAYVQRSFTIRKELAAADAGNALNRREVAAGHKQLCAVQRALQRYPDALANCAEALKLARALLDSDPKNQMLRVDVSVYLTEYGDTLRDAGRNPEALSVYREAVTYDEQMAEEQPGNLEVKGNVAMGWERLARFRGEKLGQSSEAAASGRLALGIRRAIASAKPSESRFQVQLAECALLTARWTAGAEQRDLTAEGLRLLHARVTAKDATYESLATYARWLVDAPAPQLRNPAEAAQHADQAIAKAAEPGAQLYETAARAHLAAGDAAKASGFATAGLRLLGPNGGKLRWRLMQLAGGKMPAQ